MWAMPGPDSSTAQPDETKDCARLQETEEVEGYGSLGQWQVTFAPSTGPPGVPAQRLVRLRCSAQGTFENLTGQRCVPVCGDGMLVDVDHLPQDDQSEQCDDGNRNTGDGCDGQCHVESGFICVAGSATQPDRQVKVIW
eukprot:g31662.t1